MPMKTPVMILMVALGTMTAQAQKALSPQALVELYQELHASPELSLHEEKTSAKVAAEMRKLGLEVTENS